MLPADHMQALRRYVTEGKRITFKDETKLGLLTSDDEAAAIERRASSAAAGPRPPDFHFICEVQRRSGHPALETCLF